MLERRVTKIKISNLSISSLTRQRRLLRQSFFHKPWSTTSRRSYHSHLSSSPIFSALPNSQKLDYSYNKEGYHNRYYCSGNKFIGYDIINGNNGVLHDSIRHFSIDARNNNDTNNEDEIRITTKGTVSSKLNTSTTQNKTIEQSLLSKTQEFLSKTYQTLPSAQHQEQSIRALLLEWSLLWNRKNESDSIMDFNPNEYSRDTRDYMISFLAKKGRDDSNQVAIVVDQLAHLYLDLKEEYLNNHDQVSETSSNHQQKQQQKMKQQKKRANKDSLSDIGIIAWSRAPPSTENGRNAHKILSRIESTHTQSLLSNISSHIDVHPTQTSYGSAIHAWSNSIDTPTQNCAIQAEQILQQMKDMHESHPHENEAPNIVMYNSCMNAYAIRGMVSEAESLLAEMEELEHPFPSPDAVSYTTCLNAYAKNNHGYKMDGLSMVDRANAMLERVMKRHEMYGNVLNSVTFGTIIAIHAHSNEFEGPVHAERALDLMINIYKKEMEQQKTSNSKNDEMDVYNSCKPTYVHFISVMLAYARRSKEGDARKVEELLQQMEEIYREGNKEMKPNYQCFIICIDAWARCAAKEKGSAERAEAMLGKLEDMYLNSDEIDNEYNCFGYNAVMNAWAQTETSEPVYDRAKAILQRMYDVHAIKKNDNVLPDKISFTALMKAIMKDRSPDFAMKCASILNDMEQDYAKSGNDRMRPDLIAYSTVIHAFAEAEQPKLAEVVLRRMEAMTASGQNHVPPNTVCYNTLMMAYSKNRDNMDSFDKIEEIFQEMQTIEGCQPTNSSYSIYINSLAFSDLPDKIEKAEEAFSQLKKASSVKKDRSLRIDMRNFKALLSVYSRSNLIDKADQALQVMYRIEEAFGRIPDVACYNLLLNACCYTDNSNDKARERAMEILVQVLQTIQSPDNHLKATRYTYRLLMFSCTRLIKDLKEEQEQTLKTIFENCCNDGLLDQTVLNSLYKYLRHNHNLYYDLVGKPRGSGFVRIQDLPLEWRRKQHHK